MQLKRLPEFIETRKQNWETLRRGLAAYEDYLEFSLPTHAVSWDIKTGFQWDKSGCRTDCSWFGFKISVKNDSPFSRVDLARELDAHSIGNRMLFGGNLLRQPAIVQFKHDNPTGIRQIGLMPGSDKIMNNSIFLGTYPGLTASMLSHEITVLSDYLERKAGR